MISREFSPCPSATHVSPTATTYTHETARQVGHRKICVTRLICFLNALLAVDPFARPPQLDVELEQTHLQRLLEPLVAVDGRTELTVGDDGLVATSVDEAMTTSVEAALHQSLCHDYEAAPGSIVIDAAALLDAVDGERDDDSLAQLTYTPDGSTLTLSLPSFVHTQTVDIDVTTERPDIDNPSDSVTTYHPQDDLAHALECFTDRSSIVAFGYEDVDDECYLEAVSTSEAASKITTRYRCSRERRPEFVDPRAGALDVLDGQASRNR